MAAATKVLDEARVEARARVGDIVALGLLLVVGGVLLFEMYSLGYSAGEVARNGGAEVYERDRLFVFMIIEAVVLAGALSWIVYRLLRGSAQRAGG